MITAKTGSDFKITVNSRQKYFGINGFVVEILNLKDGSVEKRNVEVEEVVKTIDEPATATVAETALKGTKTIKVSDDSTIEDGMVFKDENGNMYYVVNVKDNEIEVRRELDEDIAYNSTLTQVGNTGIYNVPLNITEKGKYNVIISNPNYDLRNLATFVDVKDNDIDDIGIKIDKSVDDIKAKIEEIKSSVSSSDDSDYEVVG